MQQHYPSLLKKLGENKTRMQLIWKARHGVINTRSLMDYMLPVFQRAKGGNVNQEFTQNLFEEFINTPNSTPGQIKSKFEKKYPPAKNQTDLSIDIREIADKLISLLQQIEAAELICYTSETKKFKVKMEELTKIVNMKIRQIEKLSGSK